MRKVIFTTAVWGKEYTFHFVNFTLPSLMAPGNIPAMAALAPVEFHIYSPRADSDRIERSPVYQRLREVATPKIIVIDDDSIRQAAGDQDLSYKIMVQTHHHLIAHAWEQDAAICSVYPDTILADGSFATVAKLAQAGKRSVHSAGISLNMHSFVPALIRAEIAAGRGQDLLGGQLDIASREVIRLAMGHIHDHSAAHILGQDGFTQWPSQMYWPLDGHGLLLRSWHPTPYFVHPRRDGSNFKFGIDGDFVRLAVDYEDCAVVEDSDDFLMLEPMPFKRRRNDKPCVNHAKPFDVANWAINNADDFHRRFVHTPIWLHDGAVPDDVRAQAWAESQAFLAEVFTTITAIEQFSADVGTGFKDLLGAPLA